MNNTMPAPLNGSIGGPAPRVEASGSTTGCRPSVRASGARCASVGSRTTGVPRGIAGSVRHARTSGGKRITDDGSELRATSRATPSWVVGSATAIGRPLSSSVSRTTASQALAIASSSSPDRQRPWARMSGMRRIDMGRVYRAGLKLVARVDMNDVRRRWPFPWPPSP